MRWILKFIWNVPNGKIWSFLESKNIKFERNKLLRILRNVGLWNNPSIEGGIIKILKVSDNLLLGCEKRLI